MTPRSLPSAVIFLVLGGLTASCGSDRAESRSFDPTLVELVSPELFGAANRRRAVFSPDGTFAFPEGIERVWIDVGAHHLETTKDSFLGDPAMALVAVEPLSGPWDHWPDTPRLIGLPVAVSEERGMMDFHVNYYELGSSLLETVPNEELPLSNLANYTVAVRSVPVVRLEDVIERIPEDLPIEYLKVDVQGLDLQVLKSAGDQIRRIGKIRTEVTNSEFYKGEGKKRRGTEAEFDEYLGSKGFRFLRELNITQNRAWLDKEYVNTRPPAH